MGAYFKILVLVGLGALSSCTGKVTRAPQSAVVPLASQCDGISNEFNQAINKISDLNLQFQQQDTYSQIHTSYLLSVHTACSSQMAGEAKTHFCKKAKTQSNNSRYDFLSLKEHLAEVQYKSSSDLIRRADNIISVFCE